ncbi:HAD hydrolase-like protein [Glaciimonas immobilis]|uniref:Phosphoglycolate phosphatase n=1 Tax=Glaciimonas immobilis TaxID=728004 RepID=A0A840RL85_9BURK|nr:HAD hydrolase-like protein [Glaciimonas immobilis]KAF3999098.1 HAD hydrolase-like protein [Glaciimonas immobilis]MBB5198533.1 phosphoglycolate phosphatase [Glaciimonas immobilis]
MPIHKQPKLIIFDFDGTLADTFPWFVNVFDELADKFDFKRLDRANLGTVREMSAYQLIMYHHVPLLNLPAIVKHARVLMRRDIANITLFSGMNEVLHRLAKSDVILAIATTNTHANVVRILTDENAALIDHFECGSSLFGKARKLRKLLAAANVTAGGAILIGDEIRDAEASAQAGIPFGAVAWGYNSLQSLLTQGPQETFMCVEDLARKLLPHTAGAI